MTEQNIIEVLLAEDGMEDASLVLQTLKQYHPDVNIKLVHDGAEALDCVFGTGAYQDRSTPYTPQLILLDLKLPRVSGLEVLRILKSYARTRTIPIVLFSNTPEERKVIEGYELGANSYVLKPPNAEKFREVVKQIGAYWLGINRMQDSGAPVENDEDTTALS
jgi:two-component system, response regulator